MLPFQSVENVVRFLPAPSLAAALLSLLAGCSEAPKEPVVKYEGSNPLKNIESKPNQSGAGALGAGNETKIVATPDGRIRSVSSEEQRRGPQTGSTTSKRTSLSENTDGGKETIWLGNAPEHLAVPWTKPQDLVLDSTFPSKDNTFATGNFCFADGSVRYIEIGDGIDADAFRALFTIAGKDQGAFARLYPKGGPSGSSGQKFTGTLDAVAQSKARMASGNNMRMIGLALENYAFGYQKLPPAEGYGPDGKPWVSWRVFVLPFLPGDTNQLFKRYDFSVPWDHPNNEYVLKNMPEVFRDTSNPKADPTKTRVMLMTGAGTAFPID